MSQGSNTASDSRVAVLVDCDNTTPEILEYALRVVAKYGRVVLRRGYGNHSTLANKWQEALVRLAFTPCLPVDARPRSRERCVDRVGRTRVAGAVLQSRDRARPIRRSPAGFAFTTLAGAAHGGANRGLCRRINRIGTRPSRRGGVGTNARDVTHTRNRGGRQPPTTSARSPNEPIRRIRRRRQLPSEAVRERRGRRSRPRLRGPSRSGQRRKWYANISGTTTGRPCRSVEEPTRRPSPRAAGGDSGEHHPRLDRAVPRRSG